MSAAGFGSGPAFVWSRMQSEAGQGLAAILARKEAERLSGGSFWWGIGNSLGPAARIAAVEAGGELPVLFSVMRSKPKAADAAPADVLLWTRYLDHSGEAAPLPPHVVVTSRGGGGKDRHYALVCRSAAPLALGAHGADPVRWRTLSGKPPGASQVTALLTGEHRIMAGGAPYRTGFLADLARPWTVRLAAPRALSAAERAALDAWRPGDDWMALAGRLRGAGGQLTATPA